MPHVLLTSLPQASRPPLHQTADAPQPQSRALLALIAACVSAFLFQFDLTALSAALPDLASSLSVASADQVWVIDVYSLAMIFAFPLAGPVADCYGRQRVFMSGAIAFALASALCATAPGFSSLLVWRALQGISGAALTASAAALLGAAYAGTRRAWAFGVWGTVIGASMVAGPPLGALVAAWLGWSWVFWINLPICGVLVLLSRRAVGDQPLPPASASLDWVGPAALAFCVGSLAFLMLTDHDAAASGVFAARAAIGLCFIAIVIFIRTERRHAAPAFDFALFGSSRFAAMCLVPIATSVGYWALLVHLPQMARGPMALSPASTGLLLTALTMPMLLLPAVGAKLADLLPARWYFAGGLGIVGTADLLLASAASDLGAPSAICTVAGALLFGGCGCALFNAQITAAVVSAVPPDRAATASAICGTMRQIGFAFGIALVGAVLKYNHPPSYMTAFTAVAACTLTLAVLVFALLSRADG